uniref:IDEAL domain-containing protein n=1 Tax=Heterorhabditis bacteriophora TaxID=37862 RepID=A0A1I7XUV1_HETBA
MEKDQFFSMTMSDRMSHKYAEIKRTVLRDFTFLSLLSRSLSDRLSLFKHFDNLQENLFNTQAAAKNAFEELIGFRTSEL